MRVFRLRSGDLYAWKLKKDEREIQVRLEGNAVFNCGYRSPDVNGIEDGLVIH